MNESVKEHSWIPLVLVACASFIITLDATFMNVSISKVVWPAYWCKYHSVDYVILYLNHRCIHAAEYQTSGHSR